MTFPCSCGTVVAKLKDVAAPYKHASVVQRSCASDGHDMGSMGHDDYHLAVEVDAGWYVGALAELWFSRRCDHHPKFPVFVVKDVVPGGSPEVTIELTNEGECRKEDFFSDRTLTIVGVGPSGVPSATRPIMLRRHQEVFTQDHGNITGDVALAVDVVLDATWTTDGSLELKGKTTGLDKEAAGDLVGTHKLSFP